MHAFLNACALGIFCQLKMIPPPPKKSPTLKSIPVVQGNILIHFQPMKWNARSNPRSIIINHFVIEQQNKLLTILPKISVEGAGIYTRRRKKRRKMRVI